MDPVIARLAEKSESFYLYREKIIKRQMKRLKESFPPVDFLYSIKCNPDPCVLDTVFSGGFGADAASPGARLRLGRGGGRTGGIGPDRRTTGRVHAIRALTVRQASMSRE